MYMSGTFIPASVLKSDSLYGLGRGGFVTMRRMVQARAQTPANRQNDVPVLVRRVPSFGPRGNTVRRVQYGRYQLGELGWFQAVANIVGAGAQIYASKEGTKAAQIGAGIQRESDAAKKELLLLESAVLERRATISSQDKAAQQRTMLLLGAGTLGLGALFVLRKSKR